MKRHEKRQLERELKKKEGDALSTGINRYAGSLKEFHENKKGNLFDWFLTLSDGDLKNLIDIEGKSKQEAAVVLYIALMANTLSTGSNEFVDENPDTDQSSFNKILNCFVHLAATAQLVKIGLIEVKMKEDKFFEWEEGGFYVRVLEGHELPEALKRVYDSVKI